MNNDDPFFYRVPEDWDVTKVGAYCQKPEYGFTESAIADEIGPKFLRITDITENGVNWDTVPYCRCPQDIFPKYELKENDILFARIGATTGKSYIAKNPPQAVFASYLIRLRPLNDLVPDFLYYFFNSDGYWDQVNANKNNNLKGGVNSSTLADIRFPLPPKKEQQKIAAVLYKIQKAIEIQESIIEKTRELKKSTLHYVFTHGLLGEKLKETEIGPIPESWDLGTIEDLCLLRNESCNPITCDSRVYVGLEHIESGKFLLRSHGSPKEVRSTKNKFNQYDILYGKLRPYLDKVVVAEVDGICSTDIIVLKLKGNTDAFFLIGLLHSDRFIQYANQTTRGVNHPRTSWTSLKDFTAPIPNSKEQKEVAHVFQTIEKKIENHTAKKTALQDLFKTMLNKLMTGEIRVKDLDIDISGVSA